MKETVLEKLMDTNSRWMMLSGAVGLAFFGIANTDFFAGLNVTAAILQLCVNAFVFVVWTKAFLQCIGFKKFVAFFGIVTPFILAGITVYRVLAPLFVN